MPRYIGVMSGTSVDSVDVALCDISYGANADTRSQWDIGLVEYAEYPFPHSLRTLIQTHMVSDNQGVEAIARLDHQLGEHFASCIEQFMQAHSITTNDIAAVGLHGQTIRHCPSMSSNSPAFTVQLGSPYAISTELNLPVIYDFRRMDMQLGGQGAPLVPPFHQALLGHQSHAVGIVNLGGIANITYLPSDPTRPIIGFDTGPANALLDAWYQAHHPHGQFDNNGAWAAQGNVDKALLAVGMTEPYFQLPFPKSTGKEQFNLAWVNQLPIEGMRAQDVMASLSDITAHSIYTAIQQLPEDLSQLYICGGGVHNNDLMTRLARLVSATIKPLENSDAIEAMAFAWLAFCYDHNIPSNSPSVTGASRYAVLGSKIKAESVL